MIIIEGMDNSGKTQLARRLSERFHLKIVKRSGPPQNVIMVDNLECVPTVMALTRAASRQAFTLETLTMLTLNAQAIYDRFPVISEGIYGPVLRDENALVSEATPWEFWLEKLFENNPLIMYCRPPDSKILSFSSRHQMSGVIEHARELIHRYDEFMDKIQRRGALVYRHDFTQLAHEVPSEYAVASYLKVTGGLDYYEYK